MEKATRISSIFALVLILNSCAFHTGVMSGNAALSDANFKVVDFAIGTSETFKVFGLGGVATDALVLEAKRNLYHNYPLTDGQALANVSVDFKRSFFLIVSKNKVMVSADVIDFNEGAVVKSKNTDFSIRVDEKRETQLNLTSEDVYYERHGELKLGRIVGFGETQVKVLGHNNRGRLGINRVPISKLFFLNEKDAILETNFKIGDEVIYLEHIVDKDGGVMEVNRFGNIFAFGQKEALIEYDQEDVTMFSKIKYKDISLKE
ncbi:DUF6567 family protein [Brumimicrobium mesophilum]|uniref:DUF6567 family protein n=1 Tax=Brumimicrobium mesophilum TaxID=392717 RepID=UPI00131DE24D|nr:DUF6567 family protein [Brumimicrobium mesophilum]